METPRRCPLGGHQHGGRKPTETCVTEFYYKSVTEFISRGTQKHKIITINIYRTLYLYSVGPQKSN